MVATTLDYFASLARSGKQPNCSSGEHKARVIAAAVLDCVGWLDSKAVDGLVEFVKLAATDYVTARSMVR